MHSPLRTHVELPMDGPHAQVITIVASVVRGESGSSAARELHDAARPSATPGRPSLSRTENPRRVFGEESPVRGCAAAPGAACSRGNSHLFARASSRKIVPSRNFPPRARRPTRRGRPSSIEFAPVRRGLTRGRASPYAGGCIAEALPAPCERATRLVPEIGPPSWPEPPQAPITFVPARTDAIEPCPGGAWAGVLLLVPS